MDDLAARASALVAMEGRYTPELELDAA